MYIYNYKCRDCHEYFDDPKEYVDYIPYGMRSVPVYSYACPCCGSFDFDDAQTVEREEGDEEEYD